MNKKDLSIPFTASLHSQDTELQTYGCRANNPDICGNNIAIVNDIIGFNTWGA